MSHQITTIPVGDRFRVGLHADVDAENPRTVTDPATGAYTHLVDNRTIDVEAGRDQLRVGSAFEHFDQHTTFTGQHDPAASKHVIRWARIFHQVTVVDDGRTLWWVDPAWMAETFPDGERGTAAYRTTEEAIIAADRSEYEKWAAGDVYGITVERKVDWNRIGPGDPDRLTTWETVDSMWGIYFDDNTPTDEAVLRCALELDVDEEYLAAFSALNDNQEASS